MRRSLMMIWDRVQTTIWFIPALFAVGGVVTALLLVDYDLHNDTSDWKWLEVFRIGAVGARQVLAVTTGAMMTITGVVFSISVVSLALAANQFGGKILRNYLSHTQNKIVLGIFIGSFLYGLVVLASINSDGDSRVPTLAVMVSLFLTVLSIAGLIYFLHNITTSIQADKLIASIGHELIRAEIDTLPDHHNDEDIRQMADEWNNKSASLPTKALHSRRSGYVEFIDYEGLAEAACESDCLLQIDIKAGQFIINGNPIIYLHGQVDKPDSLEEKMMELISIGPERTNVQDLEYAMMQLLQIAQRALSSGINDSLTAIACIDWLCAALASMAARPQNPHHLKDKQGNIRLKFVTFDFDGATDAVLNPIRQNSRGNEMVVIRLLEALQELMIACHRAEDLHSLKRHATHIIKAARMDIQDTDDLQATELRYQACMDSYQQQLITAES